MANARADSPWRHNRDARNLRVFNDDLTGEEVKLVFIPQLKISDINTQPLPETTINLHVPLGGHVSVSVPIPAPLVSKCTQLDTVITLWKGGQERYRETLEYVVNPNGTGLATADFVGIDTTTRGDWVGSSGTRTYGQQAFLLPKRIGRTGYQEPAIYLRRASAVLSGNDQLADFQDDSSDAVVMWDRKSSTTDARVPWSGVGRTTRDPVAFGGHGHRMVFRIDCFDSIPHQVSLYLLGYKRAGLSVDVDIYDTQQHRIDSRKIDGTLIDEGVYVKYRVTGAIYIVIESLSTEDPEASGLFVDPI